MSAPKPAPRGTRIPLISANVMLQGDLPEVFAVVLQVWHRFVLDFRLVIVTPQANSLTGIRQRHESLCFRLTEHATLLRQAVFGSWRQRRPVAWVNQTQVALGVDMQSNRLQHRVAEQSS